MLNKEQPGGADTAPSSGKTAKSSKSSKKPWLRGNTRVTLLLALVMVALSAGYLTVRFSAGDTTYGGLLFGLAAVFLITLLLALAAAALLAGFRRFRRADAGYLDLIAAESSADRADPGSPADDRSG